MAKTNLSIKNWSLDDRPREKLLSKGINSLSNAELIAILIGSGNKNESAVDLSKTILSKVNNNLNELGKLSIDDFKSFNGIGDAKAIAIIAALELGRRRKLTEAVNKTKITNSKDLFNIFQPILSDLPYEEFWVLCLNRHNKIIEKHKISQGGISGTVIDVRIILKLAVNELASSIILCHNHPSGNITPSNNDKIITEKLKKASEYFDIKILDHIIVADDKYFSFADESLI